MVVVLAVLAMNNEIVFQVGCLDGGKKDGWSVTDSAASTSFVCHMLHFHPPKMESNLGLYRKASWRRRKESALSLQSDQYEKPGVRTERRVINTYEPQRAKNNVR